MIIDFSVKNFLSFKDKQTLNLVASNYDKSHPENYIDLNVPSMKGIKILKGIAIYGANASGKSNLLAALSHLCMLVRESFVQGAEIDEIPCIPFLLDEESRKAASELEISFVYQRCRYDYSIQFTATRVLSEYLYAYPHGLRQTWISRQWHEERDEYEWKSKYRSFLQIKEYVKPNVLALSAANALNCAPLNSVYKWFKENIRTDMKRAMRDSDETSEMIESKDECIEKKGVMNILRCADLGVVNATVKRETLDWDISQFEDIFPRELLSSIQSSATVTVDKKEGTVETTEICLQHRGEGGKEYGLPWKYESAGTQTLFNLAAPLMQILLKGKTVVFDEIERNMHPLLTIAILKKIFSYVGEEQAQVIFTTHNPLLMDQSILRRDQVYLMEKKHEGQSTLFSMLDFKPRQKESLAGGYMVGRYGAIPDICF